MIVPFSPERTIQAAAVILTATPSHLMGKKKLLKLLYIADREFLRERGKSITGDSPVAMDQGPVLTQTYDMIKEVGQYQDLWAKFFEKVAPYYVKLLSDPGTDDLSQKQIDKLLEVTARFKDMGDNSVGDYTHEFPEWAKNKPEGLSVRENIPLDDILEAVELSDYKEYLLSEVNDSAAFKQLLSERDSG